jgi:hypothetical protein
MEDDVRVEVNGADLEVELLAAVPEAAAVRS